MNGLPAVPTGRRPGGFGWILGAGLTGRDRGSARPAPPSVALPACGPSTFTLPPLPPGGRRPLLLGGSLTGFSPPPQPPRFRISWSAKSLPSRSQTRAGLDEEGAGDLGGLLQNSTCPPPPTGSPFLTRCTVFPLLRPCVGP